MGDTLDTKLEENAAGPKKASGDVATVEQHSLPDQIAADRYLCTKKAARSRGLGIRFGKLRPPGTA